jgi:imidazolonepropionase-like amidohydrolase
MKEPIILKNAFIIDGNGGEPVADGTIVVVDKKIAEILPPGSKAQVSGGRVFDLKGKTLMPGLIDAHVHVGNIEVLHERTAALPPAVYVHRATRNLETDLDLGFTTLRDAGGLDWGFRAAIDQDLIRGPRLMLSVNMLTQSGGARRQTRKSPGRPAAPQQHRDVPGSMRRAGGGSQIRPRSAAAGGGPDQGHGRRRGGLALGQTRAVAVHRGGVKRRKRCQALKFDFTGRIGKI